MDLGLPEAVAVSDESDSATERLPSDHGRLTAASIADVHDLPTDRSSMADERFHTPSTAEYDYSRSTKDNHTQDNAEWTGPHADIREKLDHDYHGFYTSRRQTLQDDIIEDVIRGGTIHRNTSSGPWCVFTAGAMGAGKGYVIRWLSKQGYFPLPDMVQIDPDNFKDALPEWPGYVSSDRMSAGFHTRRETGYIVEVAQEAALRMGKKRMD